MSKGDILIGTSLQKLAIKKMDKEDTKEFMNELRILSTVHHANLVSTSPFFRKAKKPVQT